MSLEEVKENHQHLDTVDDAVLEQKDVVPEKVLDHSKGDLGADFMANYSGSRRDITDEEQTRVRWKIDRHLIPIICYIYFCQQLDKSSLGYSSVFGIQKDAHLVGQDYSWLNSIVYFAQLVCQPLSVYMLVKVPVNYWISCCFLGWGSSLMIMASCTNFGGLAAMRFILGGFEASIAPSMLVVVAMWWTRREQPLRNNIWYSMNGLSGIVGSILTYGVGHANNTNLHTYQLIFILCGGIAVALAIPTFFIFPRHPARAKWLSEDEKYIALERIRLNNTGTQNHDFKWSHVREAFLDIKNWLFVLMIFCVSVVSGGIGAFSPLILQGFGLDSFTTILYNMIPSAIAICTNLLSAFIITKTKYKFPTLFTVSLFPVACSIALYLVPHTTENRHKLLAIFFILGFYGCMTPIIFSWAFANTAGHTKKTTLTGMCYLGLTTGNIVGPLLYKSDQAPLYLTGLRANIGCLCALSLFIVLEALYLTQLNRQKAARRRAEGKSQLVDFSLEKSTKWSKLRIEQAEIDQEQVHHEELHNTKAFLDLTDKQNDDFIYSL